MRSTRLCGGSSLTKRTASLREMNCAVAGRVARKWSSSRPSLLPVILELLAHDFLCARLVPIGLELEPAATLGRSTVQPVRMRAAWVTSAWVYPPLTPRVCNSINSRA